MELEIRGLRVLVTAVPAVSAWKSPEASSVRGQGCMPATLITRRSPPGRQVTLTSRWSRDRRWNRADVSRLFEEALQLSVGWMFL